MTSAGKSVLDDSRRSMGSPKLKARGKPVVIGEIRCLH